MKRFLMILVAAFCVSTMAVNAQQKGQMAAGVNFDLGLAYSGGYSNFGIGAKFQYSFTDNLRVEPAFTYYFKKDYLSMWDFMANVHWVFKLKNEKFTVYPLVGLGVVGTRASVWGYSASTTNFGLNLGGGADYAITKDIAVGAELKYAIVGNANSHLGIQIGAKYLF